jgi:hypothetical protein
MVAMHSRPFHAGRAFENVEQKDRLKGRAEHPAFLEDGKLQVGFG